MASAASAPVTYPDLSNNDPASCSQMRLIASHHHPAVYLKVNQGLGFTDAYFAPQVRCAQRAGMVPGGYDFVSEYSAAEANRFVALLHAAGMFKTTPNWLPPTLDVEYGSANRAGLQRMIDILFAAFGRVNIYTGGWYWTPHFGCFWPAHVTAWISGYPTAPAVCGLPASLYSQHQFTDAGNNGAFASDMTVWLGSAAAFRAFAHIPAPVSHAVQIARVRALRATLRALLTKRGCRLKGAVYHACPIWLHEGAVTNAQLRALGAH